MLNDANKICFTFKAFRIIGKLFYMRVFLSGILTRSDQARTLAMRIIKYHKIQNKLAAFKKPPIVWVWQIGCFYDSIPLLLLLLL